MEKPKQYMMGRKKLKWYLIISLLFISVSCNERVERDNLECLLGIFTERTPSLGEDYIYISEAQNWSDTTSVVSIQYSNIPPEISDNSEIKLSYYNDFILVYSSSSFKGKLKKSHLIPTRIEWENIDENSYDLDEKDQLNYSEYELQVIYDFKNEKFSKVLKAYPLDEKELFDKISGCN